MDWLNLIRITRGVSQFPDPFARLFASRIAANLALRQ
jgi:hypothetical protein